MVCVCFTELLVFRRGSADLRSWGQMHLKAYYHIIYVQNRDRHAASGTFSVQFVHDPDHVTDIFDDIGCLSAECFGPIAFLLDG